MKIHIVIGALSVRFRFPDTGIFLWYSCVSKDGKLKWLQEKKIL